MNENSRRQRAAWLAAALAGEGEPAFIERVQGRRAAIDELVQHGRRRRYAMGVQQKLDRALEAYVRRTFTSWNPQDPKADRDRANAETQRLIEAAAKGEGHAVVVGMVKANAESRAVYDRMRKTAEKDMQAIAARLPIAAFVETVHGFGVPGLASILAETGTLDGYSNPAKIWSRLGFAPFEGFALSTYRRDTWRPRALTAEEWVAHPFSAERYAHMFTLAKPLRDHQWIGAKKTDDGLGRPDGPYGEIYAARRVHCDMTHPDWTPGHRDKDALRVMFKRLLADLWEAWMDSSFAPGHLSTDAHGRRVGSEAAAGHELVEAHGINAGGGSPLPGQQMTDAHAPVAGRAAAAGQRTRDAHISAAGGGSPIPGQRRNDAHGKIAGKAAAGQRKSDTHLTSAGGGSPLRGQMIDDAHGRHAGRAAAGDGVVDARSVDAGGGSPLPGQTTVDAQTTGAGKAAVGQERADAHDPRAGGGSAIPGQSLLDAQQHSAGTAAAGQQSSDAHLMSAGGGPSLPGQGRADAHSSSAGEAAAGQRHADAHENGAGGGPASPKRRGQPPLDAQVGRAAPPPPAKGRVMPSPQLPAAVPTQTRRGLPTHDAPTTVAAPSPPPAIASLMPRIEMPAAAVPLEDPP